MDFIKHENLHKPVWNVLILNCITNSCIRVTWQGSDYKFPEDDTIVSKHVEMCLYVN